MPKSPLSLQPDYESAGVTKVNYPYRNPLDLAPILNVKATEDIEVSGDGSEVGIFIRLPSQIGAQFPLKSQDTSPPHVTLLYIGKVTQEALLVQVLSKVLHQEIGVVKAKLGAWDTFVQDDRSVVFYSKVQFSNRMETLRDQIVSALTDAGCPIADSSLLNYTPHVTYAYTTESLAAYYQTLPPCVGSWFFDTVEIWGLSKLYTIRFGTRTPTNIRGE